ncbi:MAG: acyltransferase family protein [Rhodocyclales bacterium]|nr:acyltransferase family protein [Rhodocyclales bacterium]
MDAEAEAIPLPATGPEAEPVARRGAVRIHYLDAARSTLMSLGVVLHTAHMYDPLNKWKVTDASGNAFFHTLTAVIHLFRMPAFFMLSGFFCLMVLSKYGRSFLRIRLTRIVVPLVAAAVTLNTFQAYVLYRYHGAGAGFLDHYGEHGLLELLLSGRWVSHLWFLINLAVYTVLAYYGYRWLSDRQGRLKSVLERMAALLVRPGGMLLFPLVAFVPWAIAVKIGIPVQSAVGFIDLGELVHYGMFFLLGMYMYHQRAALEHFTTARWTVVVPIPVCAFGLYELSGMPAGSLHTLLEYCLGTFLSLSTSVLVLHFFKRFASLPSRLFAYMSEASYSVYLFHHVTVMLLGIMLMTAPINAYAKFSIVVVATFAIVLAIHHFLILRIKPLRFLFNGKYS